MDYRVLGPLEVIDDGRAVEIPGLKERGILGLLIVEAGTVVSTDRLVFELWGDNAPADAVSALRTHVSRLRKALGENNPIATQRPGYRLDLTSDTLDVARFERLADRAMKNRSNPAEASRLARTALQEWRGPALADLESFLFAETEARRLTHRRLETLEAAIAAELQLGRHAEIIPELNALTDQHPYHETFWSMLMLALYRSARAGEALETFMRAETALGEHLGIGPSAALRSLERSIVMEDPALELAASQRPNNLPHAISSFVGRRRELEHLAETLHRSRLVTLTGVGGSGKSRLATEVGASMLDGFQDGVWRIELAPVRDPEAVVLAVAAGFGEPASHASDIAASLVSFVGNKQMLLLLDNCEHLIEPVGRLVAALTSACPNLTVLATSRESLHLPGETVWLVNPLDLPERDGSAAEQENAEAFQLFLSRARNAQPTFAVTEENRSQITELCRSLSGLPLAIELAAARITAFDPVQLLERIQAGLDVLAFGADQPLDRTRTMQGCLDWSYQLLDDRLARLFSRLAVFRGGWSIGDADAVVAESGDDVAIDIASLVDKSLLIRDQERPGRYQMLEPVREFARRVFQLGEEADAVRRRHALHFLELAREGDRRLKGPDQVGWRDELEAAHDNLRKAIEWAIAEGEQETALELVAACGWFWFMSGHWREMSIWLTRALEAAGEAFPAARARAIYRTGAWEVIRVNADQVLDLIREALDTSREREDRYGEAWCLHLMGHAAMYGSEGDVGLMNEAKAIFEDLGHTWEVAWSDRYIGDVVGLEGEGRKGMELQLRSISAFRELGDMWSTAFGLHNAGVLLEAIPEFGPEAAIPYFERGLRISEDIGDRVWAAHGLRGMGECAFQLDQENAEDLLTDAIDRLRLIGDDACVSTALGLLGELYRKDGRIADSASHIAGALRIRHTLGHQTGVVTNLDRLAWLALDVGREADAVRIVSATDPVASKWGPMVPHVLKRTHADLRRKVDVGETVESIDDLIPWALDLAESIA